jgi:hypothetical protein
VPADAFADFDHIETIEDIRAAIETDGHRTPFGCRRHTAVHAPAMLDIVFNRLRPGGDARGARSGIAEMLRIPIPLRVPDRTTFDKTSRNASGATAPARGALSESARR